MHSLAFALQPRLLATCARSSVSRPACAHSRPAPSVPRPTSRLSVRAMSASGSEGGGDYVKMVNEKNSVNAVTVYSKTYCPYCAEVKSLFKKIGVEAKVLELDNIADGSSVFVGGQHVGGCDDTVAAYQGGKLKTLLEQAGVTANL
ncbi:Glutaredoxin [Chlorella vulgaris]